MLAQGKVPVNRGGAGVEGIGDSCVRSKCIPLRPSYPVAYN